MSGAGKSTVLDALEDMGWDVVDNLPTDLLQDFVRGGPKGRVRPAAVGMDVRSRGFDAEGMPALIRSVDAVAPEILYLDCAGSELIRRYDETRRRHPLAPDRPAEDGIARERKLMAPLLAASDSMIDTTDLSPSIRRRPRMKPPLSYVEDHPIVVSVRGPKMRDAESSLTLGCLGHHLEGTDIEW